MLFLLLFVGVPVAEFFLLVEVGDRLGFLNTLLLVVGTGVLGASLARQQGVGVLARMQADLGQGRPPNRAVLEAVIILISGVMLIVPGFLTDGLGVLGLLPPTRALLVKGLQRALERASKEGRVAMGGRGPMGGMFFSGRLGGRGPGGDESASAGRQMFGGTFGATAKRSASGGIRDATVVAERDGPADEAGDGQGPEAGRALRDGE